MEKSTARAMQLAETPIGRWFTVLLKQLTKQYDNRNDLAYHAYLEGIKVGYLRAVSRLKESEANMMAQLKTIEEDAIAVPVEDLKVLSITIDDLIENSLINARTYNVLHSMGAETLRDIGRLKKRDISKQINAGKKTYDQICAVLTRYGFDLPKK